ncbi:hypothetical protein [Paractinoplanes durhamensis]|uniref:Uncharacterized protein n=1 Tax=Paractinoplanes durhamensis TaxID=113563 RepID=A0ABQ3YS31_9ACTN|nr:hypothetical protein [Actinoplanes durhamensis]GIE00351.1 hypothetical protein Adu01nite_17010 [Actinoplanes durhamensis]
MFITALAIPADAATPSFDFGNREIVATGLDDRVIRIARAAS